MWKRLIIYDRIIFYILILNIGFYFVNEVYLNNFVPDDIERALTFSSIGLAIGFLLCMRETKRVWKNLEKENNQKDHQR